MISQMLGEQGNSFALVSGTVTIGGGVQLLVQFGGRALFGSVMFRMLFV